MWAGNEPGIPGVRDSEEKRHRMTHFIDVFNLADGTWKSELTSGEHPLGWAYHACTSVGNRLCSFGGCCNHDGYMYGHNSLNELNVDNFQWTQLSPTADKQGLPIRKWACGMVPFSCNNEDIALIVGGCGLPTKTPQPNAIYVTLSDGEVVTNEHHLYNFSTGKYKCCNTLCYSSIKGKWNGPTISGQCPPPCWGFTLNTLSNKKAVLYGGQCCDSGTAGAVFNNDVHTVEMTGKDAVVSINTE